MIWLQNFIIILIGFLISRILIEQELHHYFINSVFKKKEYNISYLTTKILFASYFLSLILPNTIVAITILPIIKQIIDKVKIKSEINHLPTNLMLALIYGANIGGMGSMIDLEVINNDLKIHGIKTEEILNDLGVNSIITRAIRMHNEEASKEKRTDRFHIALAAGETITGLIVATTLVYPDKKIKSVKPKSIVKRMKEKAFAASVNREIIRECERIDIPLNEFAKLSLDAMCTIDNEIGL